MNTIRILTIPLLLFFFIVTNCKSNNLSQEETNSAINSINKSNLQEIITFLTSKKLEGRLAGGKGFNQASTYVFEKFKKYSLEPIEKDNYFQNFYIEYNQLIEPMYFRVRDKNNDIINYNFGKDFLARGFSGSNSVKGELVFCGYGISDPENGYDDYNNIDVKGKILIFLKGGPKWANKDFNWHSLTYPRQLAINAKKHGALGMVYVYNPLGKYLREEPLASTLKGDGEQQIDFPQIHISTSKSKELFQDAGYDLNEIVENIDKSHQPSSFSLEREAELCINSIYEKKMLTQNIIGILEGKDIKLKDEYILIGAHLDHVGKQGSKIYFPGANDNASGVASLLEIAKILSSNDFSLKRSIVFILFSGEETGLVGSNYYCTHPVVPLSKTKLYINVDCIGAGDKINIGGGENYPNLYKKCLKFKEFEDILDDNLTKSGEADAESFEKNQIPNLYFGTTMNGYKYLHSKDDTLENMNLDLFTKTTKLICHVLVEFASNADAIN